MRVAFIARATIYKVHGGITVQVVETANHLRELGINVTIYPTNEKINYSKYDLLHFFDITRPANILYHLKRTTKPFVISPVLIDYSEYDKQHREGISGFIFRLFSPGVNEYLKTVLRWLLGKDKLQSKNYLWKGQGKSIRYILQRASLILPNSEKEYRDLAALYSIRKPYAVIPNGINEKLFYPDNLEQKDEKLVLCAARIEGIKNQLNLIKALNNTKFKLVLAGEATPNQQKYYRQCRQTAAGNIQFTGKIPQEGLLQYYKKAKVHILPSWFETCGLSSLEAAAMGCNIIITNKGYSREYFGDDAFYCDPGDVPGIRNAIEQAAAHPLQKKLQEKIINNYTWRQAAIHTLEAYKKILPGRVQTKPASGIKTAEI